MVGNLIKKVIYGCLISFGLVSAVCAQDHPWRAVEGWAKMEVQGLKKELEKGHEVTVDGKSVKLQRFA